MPQIADTNIETSLGDLFKGEDESIEKILLSLLDKENILMKSEIHMPLNLTRLKTIGHWLVLEGQEDNAKLLFNFVLDYAEIMVSFDRKSREEIIRAIEGLKEKALAEDVKPSQ